MVSLLRPFALADIWCEPWQDHQHVMRPARLTPNGGAFRRASVLWESIPTPNADQPLDQGVYHIYQIGQLPPGFFDIVSITDDYVKSGTVSQVATGNADGSFDYTPTIPSARGVNVVQTPYWYSVDSVCEANGMVIDVYLDNGVKFPRHECWIMRRPDKNLLLAVKDWTALDLGTKTKPDYYTGQSVRVPRTLDEEVLSVRFYRNALGDNNLKCVAATIDSVGTFNSFMTQCAAIEASNTRRGAGLYWLDGYIVNRPTAYNNSYQNKVLSFVWEDSIKAVQRFSVQDLFQFNSQLDTGKVKYALVRDSSYQMIDFSDDVDVYVVTGTGDNYKGVYMDRSRNDTLRMLTHNAYSVRKDQVDRLVSENAFFTTPSQIQIMLVVREGGMQRGLTQQHSRIEELYRLSYAQIKAAICTDTSPVQEWTAVELEKSAYCRIMGLTAQEITDTLIDDAYGYNAATRQVANPVCRAVSNAGRTYFNTPRVAELPDRGTGEGRRSMFCYDADGKFIGWFSSIDRLDFVQVPQSLNATAHVECFNATTSTTRDGTYFDTDMETTDLAQYGFRCYACPIVGGVPNQNWVDITGTPYYVYDPTGDQANGYVPRLTWNTALEASAAMKFCVKLGGIIHWYLADAPQPNVSVPYVGFMKLTVTAETNLNGTWTNQPQRLQPGNVDVIMDGESLIETIDYYMQWPDIVIVKRPSTPPHETSIIVRSYRHCDEQTMQTLPPREVGFVKSGILSVGCHYDVRNDRNMRIVVAGAFKDRSQVMFAEGFGNVLSTDGRPYALSDYVVPVEGFTTKETLPFRRLSLDLDNRVSDYLTERLPTIHPNLPTIVETRWSVFSPFCSAVLHALINGVLDSAPLAGSYLDSQIQAWVSPWLDLLDFDPCTKLVDRNYIHIYPHPNLTVMTVTRDQYRFLERVIRLYLHDQVDLSPMVKIS